MLLVPVSAVTTDNAGSVRVLILDGHSFDIVIAIFTHVHHYLHQIKSVNSLKREYVCAVLRKSGLCVQTVSSL